jgi:hypothetical protein
MFVLNGKPLPLDVPFTIDDVVYPANWLRASSSADKAAIGISEAAEQPRPDDRFYYVTQNADGSYTATPKDLQQLKIQFGQDTKTAALGQLAVTDWQVITSVENHAGAHLPTAINIWRDAIRTTANDYMDDIVACTSVEELAALPAPVWPPDPRVLTATPYI